MKHVAVTLQAEQTLINRAQMQFHRLIKYREFPDMENVLYAVF